MKKVLRFRKADKYIFNAIRRRLKTIETRAATIRFQDIKKRDILVFICGQERFEKEVKKVSYFKNIEDMVKSVNFKKIMPFVSSLEEFKDTYNKFPGYKEKIKKFGLVALDLS